MSYKDKVKQREAQRQHYKLNRDNYLERIAKRVALNKSYVDQVKKESGCVDCGYNNLLCLEFHHMRNKTDTISNMVKKGYGLETIKKEVDKCVVLCANCHRLRHLTSVLT